MSEIKTKVTDASVQDFINAISDDKKRQDSIKLLTVFSEVTREHPKMWGSSIIGFGQYHYKSAKSKQEGDWMLTGFSPRKQSLTLYLMDGFENHADLLENLGKYKVSKGCLYINRLEDVDLDRLKELIQDSYLKMKQIIKY